MDQRAWFEHFKHKLQGLTQSYESSGTTLSLLGYALKSKRLNYDEYLKWAMSYFKLPHLQSSFFAQFSPAPDLFAKWGTHYLWSAECMPLAEWDGCLIVACLQPPQDFPLVPPCVLVLASPDVLDAYAQKLRPTKSQLKAQTTAEQTSSLQGLDFKAAQRKSQDSAILELKDSDSFSENSESLELDSEQEDESGKLEGLSDDYTVTTLQRLKIAETDTAAIATIDDSATSPIIAPTPNANTTLPTTAFPGLLQPTPAANKPNIPPPPASSDATADVEEKTKISPLSPLKPKTADTSKSSASTLTTPPVAAVTKTTLPTPPVAPVEKASPLIATAPKAKGPSLVKAPAAATNPGTAVSSAANGLFELDKLKKKNSAVMADKLSMVLHEMKSHFEKSLILSLDDKESQASVFAWDESFQGIKDQTSRIPLRTPSIFNIVAETMKPFHGYVSLNEINEKFFEDWNQGEVPDHVTITPMIIKEKVVGMLVGFGQKSAYNRTSLNLAERLSNEFVKSVAA